MTDINWDGLTERQCSVVDSLRRAWGEHHAAFMADRMREANESERTESEQRASTYRERWARQNLRRVPSELPLCLCERCCARRRPMADGKCPVCRAIIVERSQPGGAA